MTETAESLETRGGARPALRIPPHWVAIGIYLLGAVFYARELAVLAARWLESAGDSHGWLVAAAVPVLIWLRRFELPPPPESRGRAAVAALVLLAGVSAVAHAAAVDVVSALAFPTSVALACWFVLGAAATRRLLGPIGYFAFAVPIWGVFIPPLQWLTVAVAAFLVEAVGVRALVEGSNVTVPAGTFEIAGGCSGLRFFVVALAIATFIAMVERLNVRNTMRIVLAAATMAIVMNWIRVATVMYVGNATQMTSPMVRDHYAFGWWLFAAGLVPVLLYSRRLARASPAAAAPGSRLPGVSLGIPSILAVGLLLGAGPLWAQVLDRRADRTPLLVVVPPVVGWTGAESAATDWHPAFLGAAAERSLTFEKGGQTVDAYVAFYSRQSAGKKLIGFGSELGGVDWHETAAAGDPAATSVPSQVERNVYANAAGRRRLIWSWYEVRGIRSTRPWEVKLLQATSAFGLPGYSGVVALSARCDSGCAVAESAISDAYQAGLGRLTALPEPRGGGVP